MGNTSRIPYAYYLESFFHAVVHFLSVLLIYWFVIVPPIWVSVLALVIEVVQMKLLGRCVLTRIAHRRNIMVGMTYWQYIASVFGVKHHKQAGFLIDTAIKLSILGLLVLRTLLWMRSDFHLSIPF